MTAPSADRPFLGLRVVEAASFVAGPSAGSTLAQLGAEVIRVDPPGGGADRDRWPVTADGRSLYWPNLNRGKRSVMIDHRSAEGRELLLALATTSGAGAGIFVDNMAGRERIRYAELANRRPDQIQIHLVGRSDGTPAVDYTVNAALGVPDLTGPQDHAGPVNHVVPAWDLLAGTWVVAALLGALRVRDATGAGSDLQIALEDVALAALGSLGWLAEAKLNPTPRRKHGNHVYGSFGIDLPTSDGGRVMVVALTAGQWRNLCRATGTTAVMAALQAAWAVDLDDERQRFHHRDALAAVLRPWFAARSSAEVARELDSHRVLWGPYRTLPEAARLAAAQPDGITTLIDQPGIGPMLTTLPPVRSASRPSAQAVAPLPGADTDRILTALLGLSDRELGSLHARKVISDPTRTTF